MNAASTSSPHIVHITAPAEFGGLETVVRTLSGGLLRRGISNSVIAVLDRPQLNHPFVDALSAGGIQVFPIVIGAREYVREAQVLTRIVREIGASVIHTHGSRSDVIGGWVAHRERIPHVSTLHGFMATTQKGRLVEWIQLHRLRKFDAVVGVSAGIVDRARAAGIPRNRVHLIPNAWVGREAPADRTTARRALGIPDDVFSVGWVGRLSYEKGADIFLDALAQWHPPGVLASIIGDGAQCRSLKMQVAASGITGLVRWHGAHRDAGQLMRAFDVLVLSSRTEGVPMVLLEAMHAGTPVIATAVGGVPSVVDSSEAILVPPDSATALAVALEQLRQSPAETLARAARATCRLAKQHAVEPWLDRYVAIYRDISTRSDL